MKMLEAMVAAEKVPSRSSRVTKARREREGGSEFRGSDYTLFSSVSKKSLNGFRVQSDDTYGF